jgi:hypothetical protein
MNVMIDRLIDWRVDEWEDGRTDRSVNVSVDEETAW